MRCLKITYIFKICVNINEKEQLGELVAQLDDYLCLGRLIPNDPFGLCLGVVKLEIDGEIVKLAIWTVNENNDRPWVRLGGTEINYSQEDFHKILLEQAQSLISAAA